MTNDTLSGEESWSLIGVTKF